MGSRIGVIFHNNYQEFSPLLYCHNGVDIPYQLQLFLQTYDDHYGGQSMNSGHLYNCQHMMADFIGFLQPDPHTRIENLSAEDQQMIAQSHDYPNGFDEGCWLVNVSHDNFGALATDNTLYYVSGGNLVYGEIVEEL